MGRLVSSHDAGPMFFQMPARRPISRRIGPNEACAPRCGGSTPRPRWTRAPRAPPTVRRGRTTSARRLSTLCRCRAPHTTPPPRAARRRIKEERVAAADRRSLTPPPSRSLNQALACSPTFVLWGGGDNERADERATKRLRCAPELLCLGPFPSCVGRTGTPRTEHFQGTPLRRPQCNIATNYRDERAPLCGSPAIAARDVAERETKERNAPRKTWSAWPGRKIPPRWRAATCARYATKSQEALRRSRPIHRHKIQNDPRVLPVSSSSSSSSSYVSEFRYFRQLWSHGKAAHRLGTRAGAAWLQREGRLGSLAPEWSRWARICAQIGAPGADVREPEHVSAAPMFVEARASCGAFRSEAPGCPQETPAASQARLQNSGDPGPHLAELPQIRPKSAQI